jgi:hypothetical protein
MHSPTDSNRVDIRVTKYAVTAMVDGQHILFRTKDGAWTVGIDTDLDLIALAAITLMDFERRVAA